MFSRGIERKTWHEVRQLQSNPQKQPLEMFCEKRCFLVNFVKFLRTPVLQKTSGQLQSDPEISMNTYRCAVEKDKKN